MSKKLPAVTKEKIREYILNTMPIEDVSKNFYFILKDVKDKLIPSGAPTRTEVRVHNRTLQVLAELGRIPSADNKQETEPPPEYAGVVESPDKRRETTTSKTFLFTCAQNNTPVHQAFFNNLVAYSHEIDAELHISRFTYNKGGFSNASVKPGSQKATDNEDLWYDPQISDYISDMSLQVAPTLVWCGELNILPTRANPLTGFNTYTRQASSIIPHTKIAMESIPTMKHSPTKFMYSTGAVTQRNYIQKSAGQKAEFHHVFGALIVEVDDSGNWWCRQINATDDGSFYDLDAKVEGGQVTFHNPVEAITHGDLHISKVNQSVVNTVFSGKNSVMSYLKPKMQFFHDSVDFTVRNHHSINDPHFLAKHASEDDVTDEFFGLCYFFRDCVFAHPSRVYVVVSNHDQAVKNWLKNPKGQFDPVNSLTWHHWNTMLHRLHSDTIFTEIVKETWREIESYPYSSNLENFVTFIQEDESFKILGQIEAGLHGHLGPNGSRGNPKNLRTVGKANTGHTHSAGIIDGIYTSGVYANLDMGYNKGLSSWSHSLTVTYPNAKRAILTIANCRAWRDQYS